MGTSYSIQILRLPDSTDITQLQQLLDARLESINRVMSTYDPHSAISLFNQSRKTGWHTTEPELIDLVNISIELSRQSDGAFDITVGPLVNLWGFGPDKIVSIAPNAEKINAAMRYVGMETIKTDIRKMAIWKSFPDTYIDLSAIAKGYAVDELAGILQSKSIHDYMIEIGGEIHAHGKAPHGDYWRVGIETPQAGKGKIEVILQLKNMSIATSGDYRNFFEYEGRRYSHTIDPGTGSPVNHDLASVSVLHKTATEADALATAMMVMGADKAQEFAERRQLAVVMIKRNQNKYSVLINRFAQPHVVVEQAVKK